MTRQYVLDAQEMEPPEPLLRALELAEVLDRGCFLHLRHRREPVLLYDNLRQRGFAYLSRAGTDVAWEVFIWRADDAQAAAAARTAADRKGQPDLMRS